MEKLSILLLVCVKNLSESKVDLHFDALEITSSNLIFTQKQGIFNNYFGATISNQVLATTSQCDVFVFRENYHPKVIIGRILLAMRNKEEGTDSFVTKADTVETEHIVIP